MPNLTPICFTWTVLYPTNYYYSRTFVYVRMSMEIINRRCTAPRLTWDKRIICATYTSVYFIVRPIMDAGVGFMGLFLSI